jgi:hypothetical protein
MNECSTFLQRVSSSIVIFCPNVTENKLPDGNAGAAAQDTAMLSSSEGILAVVFGVLFGLTLLLLLLVLLARRRRGEGYKISARLALSQIMEQQQQQQSNRRMSASPLMSSGTMYGSADADFEESFAPQDDTVDMTDGQVIRNPVFNATDRTEMMRVGDQIASEHSGIADGTYDSVGSSSNAYASIHYGSVQSM